MQKVYLYLYNKTGELKSMTTLTSTVDAEMFLNLKKDSYSLIELRDPQNKKIGTYKNRSAVLKKIEQLM